MHLLLNVPHCDSGQLIHLLCWCHAAAAAAARDDEQVVLTRVVHVQKMLSGLKVAAIPEPCARRKGGANKLSLVRNNRTELQR
jgi:hypothetical protein